MRELGRCFAGALHRFLPLILSPWFVFGGSGVSLREVLSAAQGHLPETISLKDVADFVVATRMGGANLLGVLHSLGYTRGLLEALSFPEAQRLERMLRFALMGEREGHPQSLSVAEEALGRPHQAAVAHRKGPGELLSCGAGAALVDPGCAGAAPQRGAGVEGEGTLKR